MSANVLCFITLVLTVMVGCGQQRVGGTNTSSLDEQYSIDTSWNEFTGVEVSSVGLSQSLDSFVSSIIWDSIKHSELEGFGLILLSEFSDSQKVTFTYTNAYSLLEEGDLLFGAVYGVFKFRDIQFYVISGNNGFDLAIGLFNRLNTKETTYVLHIKNDGARVVYDTFWMNWECFKNGAILECGEMSFDYSEFGDVYFR